MLTGSSLAYNEMKQPIEILQQICASRDVAQLILRLKGMVPEYNPSSHVLQRALEEKPLRVDKRAIALAVGAR
jgi:hypothetical protein